MSCYRTYWRAWERLASYVHLGMIDWEVVYEVMPYPHEEWERCEPVRKILAQNWYGANRPLPDFMLNMARLQKRYMDRYRDDKAAGISTESVLSSLRD